MVLAAAAVFSWTWLWGHPPNILPWLVVVSMAAATTAAAVAARRAEPRWRALWAIISATACVRTGAAVAAALRLTASTGETFALLHLVAGVGVAAAVAVIMRRRLEVYAWSWPEVLDASVIVAAISLAGWDTIVEPAAAHPLSATGTAELACGLAAVAGLIGLAVIGSRSRGAIGLPVLAAAAGLLAWAVTQAAYTSSAMSHPSQRLGATAVGWTLAGALVGLGAVSAIRPGAANTVLRWTLEDINLPVVLLGIVVTQVFVTITVLDRPGYIGAVLAGTYTFAVVLLRLLLTGRSRRQLGQALGEALTTQRRLERERDVVFAQMLRAEADERARVAADLHDDTVQIMVATLVSLDRVSSGSREQDPDRVAAAAASARHTLNEAVERTRRLMFELRPPLLETHGLEAAARDAAGVLARAAGLEVRVSAVATRRYTPAVEALVFRTVQEALANIRKHAQATTVQIDIRDDGASLHTRVIDDGRGFDVGSSASPTRERMHYGIAMMTERVRLAGGDCWISSAPGHGCTVSFSLPHGICES